MMIEKRIAKYGFNRQGKKVRLSSAEGQELLFDLLEEFHKAFVDELVFPNKSHCEKWWKFVN